jgi:hypothetical protein
MFREKNRIDGVRKMGKSHVCMCQEPPARLIAALRIQLLAMLAPLCWPDASAWVSEPHLRSTAFRLMVSPGIDSRQVIGKPSSARFQASIRTSCPAPTWTPSKQEHACSRSSA